MADSFPLHIRPNQSVLEGYRDEIVAMRRSYWPYRRIAAWFGEEKGVLISHEAVRQFCLVRGISKCIRARNTSTSEVAHRSDEVSSSVEPLMFEYDDSKPIRIKRARED